MLRSGSSGLVDDDNPGSLSRKITVLEMKELNERQRAEYAQKLYDQQRITLRQMEDRNLELEKKFSELTRMNLEMQRSERELRDDLAHSVPRTVSDADKRYISDLKLSLFLNNYLFLDVYLNLKVLKFKLNKK
jgi:centrosomal protein CEP290